MRTTRTIVPSLCAVLGVAALAGPAAAGQQGAHDSAKANAYVPPAALYTAAPADRSAKANVYVPPAALSAPAPAARSAKADVYVPPAALYPATPAKADVPTAPSATPISRHAPAASAPSSGFDWGSAGIGAAVVAAALLIGLGGAAELRRRRQIQPAAMA
jgi:hypothetical protein